MGKKLCSQVINNQLFFLNLKTFRSSSCSICILKNEDLWDIFSKLMFLAPGLETPMFTPTTNVASSGLPMFQCCQLIWKLCSKIFRDINLHFTA